MCKIFTCSPLHVLTFSRHILKSSYNIFFSSHPHLFTSSISFFSSYIFISSYLHTLYIIFYIFFFLRYLDIFLSLCFMLYHLLTYIFHYISLRSRAIRRLVSNSKTAANMSFLAGSMIRSAHLPSSNRAWQLDILYLLKVDSCQNHPTG